MIFDDEKVLTEAKIRNKRKKMIFIGGLYNFGALYKYSFVSKNVTSGAINCPCVEGQFCLSRATFSSDKKSLQAVFFELVKWYGVALRV